MNKIVAAVAIAAGLLVGTTACAAENPSVTCKVLDKDRSTGKENQSIYRIYTEGGEAGNECGTFSVADNIFKGNYNASDMYARIKVGSTYKFTATGVRNGFFSWFPEISTFSEVKP